MIRQTVALRPAGERKGFTGRTVSSYRNVLISVAVTFKIARHIERLTHIEPSPRRVGYAGSFTPSVSTSFEVAILQHIVGVGVRVVFQLRGIHIYRALTVNQNLYLYALCACNLKGNDQTGILAVVLGKTLTDTENVA